MDDVESANGVAITAKKKTHSSNIILHGNVEGSRKRRMTRKNLYRSTTERNTPVALMGIPTGHGQKGVRNESGTRHTSE